MGHAISLDMGLAMLRLTIFDRRGRLAELLKEDAEGREEDPVEEKKGARVEESLSEDGFTHYLSFYSSVHNGTFYFLQFNIIRTTKVDFELLRR